MHTLEREIEKSILKKIQPGKVVIITGARRVGKTVLLHRILDKLTAPCLLLNGEDITTHTLLSQRSAENYNQLLGSKRLLIIDEAQNIPDIGQILKLMVDEIDGLMVVISGSSAFGLFDKTGEPLTGRKYSYILYPFCEGEYQRIETKPQKLDKIRQRLIYGNYPELIHIADLEDKREYIREMISSYLLKDILLFENIKNSSKVFNLLRLVAFQISTEVSYQELGRQLSLSKNTVEKYLDLLSKIFIVHKVEGFSKNLRKEISKSPRWYFYDNGIRNAIVANFNPIDLRDDLGLLWENYIISERIKYQNNTGMTVNNYFWRTYDQQEIDWVEEREGNLFGYEFKWRKKDVKAPAAWVKAYPDAKYQVITMENFETWITRQ